MGGSGIASDIIVVGIIQARMGSTRFPGKMLAPLGGHPVLEWVLRRVERARSLDRVILATSDDTRDDALAELARKCNVDVFRGSESDVLGRFVGAAGKAGATQVVRVCADNPFIDPGEIDRLVEFFGRTPCDCACNHQDRLGSRYADGFGAEIVHAPILEAVAARATESRHREHVTLFLWEHPADYCLKCVPAPAPLAFPEQRFDVDTPGDLERLERLLPAGIGMHSSAAEIVAIARKIADRRAS